MERLVIECIIRSTLIAAGAGVLLSVFRVTCPKFQHLAWTGVTISMLLLPAWTTWGPKASFPLLPASAPIFSDNPSHLGGTSTLSSPIAAEFNENPRSAAISLGLDWGTFLAGIYLIGAGIFLVRLGMGIAGTRRMIRSSVFINGRWSSEQCVSPVTVGIFTPMVILPHYWPTWREAQLKAVLFHESQHVQRRDTLVQLLALCNRALFWFHPLAWWLNRELSLLAEEACDDFVIAEGYDPNDYCAYLLDIARSVAGAEFRMKPLGLAMPGDWLSQRIRRLLARRARNRIGPTRIAITAILFLVLSSAFIGGTIERTRSLPQAPTGLNGVEDKVVQIPRPIVLGSSTRWAEEEALAYQSAPSQPLAADTVERITVMGHRLIALDTIMAAIKLKPGATLASKAVASDVRSIYSLGYFTDVVANVDVGPQGGKIVTFLVREKLPDDAADRDGFLATRSVSRQTTTEHEEKIIVTIDKDQRLFLQSTPVNLNELGPKILEKLPDPSRRSIYLQADESVPFGTVTTVMNLLKSAGIYNISIITYPYQKPKRP